MKNIFSMITLFSFLITQSGCATIVSRGTQDVKIQSNPQGASVEIDGMKRGQTPLFLKLEREDRHTIRIQKEGYEEAAQSTFRGFNWWFMGNIILGGIIGIIVDFATGAVYTIKPNDINVELKKQE